MLTAGPQCHEPVLLPDFLIVGAAKSGTTLLHDYLAQHPEVCMPTQKEPRFFSFADSPPRYTSPDSLSNSITTLSEYLSLFEQADMDKMLGDASPSYLYLHQRTIGNMERFYDPDDLSRVHIIILLRQPADRAWSQYGTFARLLQEPLPYEQAIKPEIIQQRLQANWNIFYDYLGFGAYTSQVRAFINRFGRRNVSVYLFEDLTRDPIALCRSLFEIIGVDRGFVPNELGVRNPSGRARSKTLVKMLKASSPIKATFKMVVPALQRQRIREMLAHVLLKKVAQPARLRRELTNYFSDDIDSLAELIQRDLSHWK